MKATPTSPHGHPRARHGGGRWALEGAVYLVQGPPGSGKTILANPACPVELVIIDALPPSRDSVTSDLQYKRPSIDPVVVRSRH